MESDPMIELAHLDERRVLIMSMQALLDVEVLRVISALINGERSMAELGAELGVELSMSRGPLGRGAARARPDRPHREFGNLHRRGRRSAAPHHRRTSD